MNHQLIIQPTPNPNAFKFIIDIDVINDGKITYKSIDDCEHNPMAHAIFMLGSVTDAHFFENVITITKTEEHPWAVMEEAIKATILQHIDRHDPNFIQKNSIQKPKRELSPELQKIDAILEKAIRPSLRMDGGDLTILNFEGKVLSIHYEGACGSCPSSQWGTLQAIQNVLRSEYDEEIEVVDL